ncbi:protein-disulfide isomerase [Halohasta litchfieldiae]|jgi:protein-disulfide isomerase|uniref:Protein-disulfide isomerase n=1 Tax=Halohasta litchfieldiae TaxID=1073996 RepID=A0A1H6S927_9EURY|nr:thioredoxin domain-containing protein [Halohasta litchfieldiae]ATW87971.1 protein-disulfide isomerase [Halohasta litchfieldiae]SEI61277.1 Protein-disulfide isomerase [Halohasta litchfieldiae]
MDQTRRGYLAATGAVAVGTVGLSGCLGGGNSAADTSHSCELTDREPVDELPQPTLGGDDAAITVELFEDFACPHCATFVLNDLDRLESEYAGDDVQFERYDFLVVNSEWNEPVANAARSIQAEYDDETFFEFATAAYENQEDYSWQRIGDLAEQVGADPCRVLSDASNGTYQQVIEANGNRAQELGIGGTPGARVDGTVLDSVASYDAISSAIENAL